MYPTTLMYVIPNVSNVIANVILILKHLFLSIIRNYKPVMFKLDVYYIKFHINMIFRCLPYRHLLDDRTNGKLEVVNFSSYFPYTNNIIALISIFLYCMHI